MMSPETAFTVIYNLCNVIYEQYQLVKANKKQAARLVERVQVIEQAIKKLDADSENSTFSMGLKDLTSTLQNAIELLKKFSSDKWYKNVIKAGNNKEAFDEINTRLAECLPQLQLGINVAQFKDQQTNAQDQQDDLLAIQNKQQHLIELNYAELNELHGIKNNQNAAFAFLQAQMDSLLQQVGALSLGSLQPKNSKDIELTLQIPLHLLNIQGVLERKRTYRAKYGVEPVLVKRIIDFTAEEFEAAIREIAILSQQRSQYINQFLGAYIDHSKKEIYIVTTELDGQMVLQDAIQKSIPLSMTAKHKIAKDIAAGLNYLHDKSILHRNLTTEAIVIYDNNQRAKIGEMALAKISDENIATVKHLDTNIVYMAPEVINGKRPDAKSDIFAFGTLLFVLYVGQEPFERMQYAQKAMNMQSGNFPLIPETVPSDVRELITSCWSMDAYNRPSAIDCFDRFTDILSKPAPLTAEDYYRKGQALEKQKNYEEAKKHYKAAVKVDPHFAKVHNKLGFFYGTKEYIDKVKLEKSFKHFQIGAENGHLNAMYNLAKMYQEGKGCDKDLNLAIKWYTLSAKIIPTNDSENELVTKANEKLLLSKAELDASGDYSGQQIGLNTSYKKS